MHTLAKKQPGKVNEGVGGQLSFDFSVVNKEDAQAANTADTAQKESIPGQDQAKEQEEAILSRYDIGYGFMGNGLTVWNRLEKDGDYKTIAHIDADRNVTFYEEGLPEIIQEQIRKVAAKEQMNISATQEIPVFSTPPQTEKGIQTREDIEAAPKKSPVQIYREALSTLSDVVRQSGFHDYLRGREVDYNRAANELNYELGFFIDEIAESQPDLYDAFQNLPLFRVWMVEDIVNRIYQDEVTDNRDAIDLHTENRDAPKWVKEDTVPCRKM